MLLERRISGQIAGQRDQLRLSGHGNPLADEELRQFEPRRAARLLGIARPRAFHGIMEVADGGRAVALGHREPSQFEIHGAVARLFVTERQEVGARLGRVPARNQRTCEIEPQLEAVAGKHQRGPERVGSGGRVASPQRPFAAVAILASKSAFARMVGTAHESRRGKGRHRGYDQPHEYRSACTPPPRVGHPNIVPARPP